MKSVSVGNSPPSAAFSQEHASANPSLAIHLSTLISYQNSPAGLTPQAQVAPVGLTFSVELRSQVHSPAGRARHEQRGPLTVFSCAALSQVQLSADF